VLKIRLLSISHELLRAELTCLANDKTSYSRPILILFEGYFGNIERMFDLLCEIVLSGWEIVYEMFNAFHSCGSFQLPLSRQLELLQLSAELHSVLSCLRFAQVTGDEFSGDIVSSLVKLGNSHRCIVYIIEYLLGLANLLLFSDR